MMVLTIKVIFKLFVKNLMITLLNSVIKLLKIVLRLIFKHIQILLQLISHTNQQLIASKISQTNQIVVIQDHGHGKHVQNLVTSKILLVTLLQFMVYTITYHYHMLIVMMPSSISSIMKLITIHIQSQKSQSTIILIILIHIMVLETNNVIMYLLLLVQLIHGQNCNYFQTEHGLKMVNIYQVKTQLWKHQMKEVIVLICIYHGLLMIK